MALPQLHIVKIGGKLINEPEELDRFLTAFSQIEGPKILIHGGGRKATELSEQMGLEVKMIEGRRITDQDTLEVAIMVYAGLINKTITALLQSKGTNAIGLCGADGNMIKAHKRPIKEIDYGWVGDIDEVDGTMINSLLSVGFVPVFCAISHDQKGQLLNTNADTIASVVAKSMTHDYCVSLKFCFEFDGVLHSINDPQNTIDIITADLFDSMKSDGTINSGMIPKLSNGLDALKGGAHEVAVCGVDNLITLKNATILSL
jgi:acetylglutamate kinase